MAVEPSNTSLENTDFGQGIYVEPAPTGWLSSRHVTVFGDLTFTQVFVKVTFLKVGEIDTKQESYAADVFVQARWREPAFDGKKEQDANKIDWSKVWSPSFRVQNAFQSSKITSWHELKVGADGKAFVLEKMRIVGRFTESLELKSFPFDLQDMSVCLISSLSEFEVEFLEDEEDMSSLNAQSFADEQEWHLYEAVDCYPITSQSQFSSSPFKHPGIVARFRASRRAKFFIWNIFFITLLITSLSLSTFAVSNKLTQNRLQLSFTLVLTATAFKFVVNQSLPKIPYLTYLDIHVLSSMVWLYIVCVWHAIISRFTYDEALADKVDLIAFIVVASGYVAFQIAFALYIFIATKRDRKMSRVKDAEYRQKALKVLGDKYNKPKRKPTKSARVAKNADYVLKNRGGISTVP